MATKKLKSIKGRRMRITRVDDCGVPVVGAGSQIVTGGFVKVTWSAEYEKGQEYISKNAWGELEINEMDADVLKWMPVKIEFVEVDPDVADIIGGATPVVFSGDTIGVTWGKASIATPFALEIWTKKAGSDNCTAGNVQEWGYFVAPFVKNGKLDGDMVIENGPLTFSLAAQAYGATDDWAFGPYGDRPFRVTFPVDEMLGTVVTSIQPPALTAGAIRLPNIAHVIAGDVFPTNPSVTAQDATNAGNLVSYGYVTTGAAWATGEFFTIGTFKFNWSGTVWAAGVHA